MVAGCQKTLLLSPRSSQWLTKKRVKGQRTLRSNEAHQGLSFFDEKLRNDSQEPHGEIQGLEKNGWIKP